MGRRNLTQEQRAHFIGKYYDTEKKRHGAEAGGRGNQHSEVKDQNDLLPKSTAGKIASEMSIGEASVKRAGKFAQGVDAIASVDPEAKQAILSGKSLKSQSVPNESNFGLVVFLL